MTTDLLSGVEVLLVEDDETTRVFLTKMMEGMGYSVEAVPHAEDGLRRSQEHFFPVMVIDWLMPDGHMTGLELIRHVRAQPDGDRSAILVVTVRDQASDLEAVMNAGADDYIPKPVSADVLRIRLRIAQERTRHLVARASAEHALEQSETRLRTVVANAPLILFLLDRKGIFTYADGRGLSVLGLERSQVVGQSVFDVYRDVPDIAGHVSRALSGETFTSDSTIRGVSLESWYTPLQSMPGQLPDGVIVVSTDVTERKKIEQELRDSEARFRSFSEAAFEGLALLDRGVVIDANQQIADMFSVDSGEVLGTRALDFVAKEDRIRANRYLTESRTTPFELNAVRRTGERIRVEVRLRPLAVGERLVTVAAVHDITQKRHAEEERKRLEDQFRQARKLESLGVLAGGIAHDFNNLLMGVLGNASLALMDLPEESPIAAYVHQIETAAQRAAELTNQMLAFSGKGRFVVKRLNMSDFIRENTQYLEDSMGSKTTIQYRLDEDLPAIDGDTGQIRQIITNLVANAADAIGEAEGVIRISTGVRRVTRDAMSGTLFAGEVVDGFRVYLEVRDSGIGMDNGTLARVFDPFFTTKFTGRGLGMAAVLGIVRGHKGAIKIASQQNSGTTVTVLFPPADETEITTGDAEEAQPTPVEESRTVLVIDDEEAVRMVTGTMLERSGFTVLLAEDGRKGIDLYKSNAPEIVAVLLDLTMPDLTGDQVFEQIRDIDPTVRVILMSGYDQKEATKRFGTEGLAGFLQKPFAARVLRERLASLTTA